MLKNFNVPIKNLSGMPFVEKEKDVLLKDICINVLHSPEIENGQAKRLSGEEHMIRYNLSKKIFNAEDEVEVTSEQISLLKKLIASNYTSAIVGACFEILES